MGKSTDHPTSKERNLCAAFFHWEILGYLAKSEKELFRYSDQIQAKSELERQNFDTNQNNYHNSASENNCQST